MSTEHLDSFEDSAPFRDQDFDEAVARRILCWMKQIQRDRSLPTSALGTAFSLMRDKVHGIERVDLAQLRAFLGPHGHSLDRDIQALVRGRHLRWHLGTDGTACATMVFRRGGRQ